MNKRRKLWLRVGAEFDRPVRPSVFWGTLRKAVRSEDYDAIPESWNVSIHWRNKEGADMKQDEFGNAMAESAESSEGWRRAVLAYIGRQIGKLPSPRSVGPLTGAATRRARREKLTAAARKGWTTRRARAAERESVHARRSAAAFKGWRTRRGKG